MLIQGIPVDASEPEFVAQTHELGHVASREQIDAWFKGVVDEAKRKGLSYFRYSISPNGSPPGLLFEAWADRPRDQGPLRWAFTDTTYPVVPV